MIQPQGVLVVGGDDGYFFEWFNKKQNEIGKDVFIFWAHHSSLIEKQHDQNGLSFSFINGPRFETNLRGNYNYMNIFLATQLCSRYLPIESIIESLKSFRTLPGRLDIAENELSTVYIDQGYAPFQLSGSLDFLRDILPRDKRIITVLGVPLSDLNYSRYSGSVASKLSDMLILAPNDPNTKHTYDINSEIYTGAEEVGGRLIDRLHSSQEYRDSSKDRLRNNIGLTYSQGLTPVISFDAHDYTGRLDAIHFAKSVAETGDIILLAGKGDANSLVFNNIEYEWSDYEAVRTSNPE
jgi:UDP-N-acetylmuramyl tripeptide synthase